MPNYVNKKELILEIEKTAHLFINEFKDLSDKDRDLLFEGIDRTPSQMIAYQLGWLNLLMAWDKDELKGKDVVTPAPGYK